MTIFQIIIYAIIHGITDALPLSSQAHDLLIPPLIGWQPPFGPCLGALMLGSFLSFFFYFRHDWASMISCFLQVLIYRKSPMTLDERMPIFLILTMAPLLFVSSYFHERLIEIEWTPLMVAISLGGMGLCMGSVNYWSRKTKNMMNWNSFDALGAGILLLTALIPGSDYLTGILIGSLFLDYKLEAALKYAYFIGTPLLLWNALPYLKITTWSTSAPSPELSWLSFGTALLVTFLVNLFCINGLMKNIQKKGFHQIITYRLVLAIGMSLFYGMKLIE